MRRSKTLVILLLATAVSSHGQAPRLNDWKIIGPGGGGTMISPTISPHDPRLVVEHCDMTGGYITQNDGQSWRMFNLRGGINTFAFDPANDKVIYAGNAALWRSTDKGQSWEMIFPSPAQNTVEHQVGDHSEYKLTSDDPVYPGGDISAIAIDPQNPKHLYIAFESKGNPGVIVSSEDGGASWKRLSTLPRRVLLLSVQDGKLTALAGSAAYQFGADGNTREVSRIQGDFAAAGMARGDSALRLYATSHDGKVYVSEDSGRQWTVITPALGQSAGRFEAIAASENHPEVAYVGFRNLQLASGKENLFNGVAKTVDGGKTWKIVFKESTNASGNLTPTWIEQRATQDGESIFFDSPYSLGVAPTNPDVAYATDLFRTYRTLDGGSTWEEVNSAPASDNNWVSRGLDVTTDYGVQVDPFNPKHIFIDYTDIGLFQSSDGGKSWRSSSEGIPEKWRNTAYWVAFDPAERGLMWGAFSGVHDLPRPKMWRGRSPQRYRGGVAVSADGGLHWHPSGTGMPPTSVTHILLDPDSPVGNRTLYATAFGRGVFKSTDNGKTWILKNTGIAGAEPFAWRITPGKDGSLYLVVSRRDEKSERSEAGAGALYRSVDKAEHWQRIDLPQGVTGPTGLQIDPRDQQRLYLTAWGQEGDVVDTNGGVYVSDNGGKTWRALYTQSQHVYDLTIDPHNPDILYISGFDAGAFRSTDRGEHWTRIKGYNFKWGHRVIPDPNDPTKIYITTYGGGVWHGPADGGANKEDVVHNVAIAH
ncbi:MAG TPA: hypothetical protein VK578_07575 [Edaphobacter sp.]|nr:hypothetical protein [Edaphobacter sp.]